jgi:hypothetical protein
VNVLSLSSLSVSIPLSLLARFVSFYPLSFLISSPSTIFWCITSANNDVYVCICLSLFCLHFIPLVPHTHTLSPFCSLVRSLARQLSLHHLKKTTFTTLLRSLSFAPFLSFSLYSHPSFLLINSFFCLHSLLLKIPYSTKLTLFIPFTRTKPLPPLS